MGFGMEFGIEEVGLVVVGRRRGIGGRFGGLGVVVVEGVGVEQILAEHTKLETQSLST